MSYCVSVKWEKNPHFTDYERWDCRVTDLECPIAYVENRHKFNGKHMWSARTHYTDGEIGQWQDTKEKAMAVINNYLGVRLCARS